MEFSLGVIIGIFIGILIVAFRDINKEETDND